MRSYGMHAIIRLSKADGKEKSGTDGIKEWKWLFNHCYARALRFRTFPSRFTFASNRGENDSWAALIISKDSRFCIGIIIAERRILPRASEAEIFESLIANWFLQGGGLYEFHIMSRNGQNFQTRGRISRERKMRERSWANVRIFYYFRFAWRKQRRGIQ